MKNILEPYLKQLKPSAEKDMIKACSKLAFMKIQRHLSHKKKRKHDTSDPSSSSTSSSSSSSGQDLSDEDMFDERRKKKKRKGPTSILPTQLSEDSQNHDNRDPLFLSDNSESDN